MNKCSKNCALTLSIGIMSACSQPTAGTESLSQNAAALLTVTVIGDGEPAPDASEDVYLVSVDEEQALQLTRVDGEDPNLPLLSEVGVFADTARLRPAAGLLPYSVQNPLWSDGAQKRRWIGIPEGTSASMTADGRFEFPVGTVLVKHFEFALDERQPEVTRRLETRVIVVGEDGRIFPMTYKWNAEQTDAEPVLTRETETLTVIQEDGSVREQAYSYPEPSDCLVCHNREAGGVLGVRTAQLNGPLESDPFGPTANQLVNWSELGLLSPPVDEAAAGELPSLAPLTDTSRTVEDRVRSYWDSNCSMCHGTMNQIRARWDARYQTPLQQQGVIDGPILSDVKVSEESRIVVPGDLENSMLLLRDGSVEPEIRMPPLGRNRTDEAYIALLEEWILSLPVPPVAGGRNP